jgi:hypothetical protein
VYYDERRSVRGIVACVTKPVRRERASEIVQEQLIIARMLLLFVSKLDIYKMITFCYIYSTNNGNVPTAW